MVGITSESAANFEDGSCYRIELGSDTKKYMSTYHDPVSGTDSIWFTDNGVDIGDQIW